jgi:beta-glucosidase/6-phospho-beta-glucosidase/beta-galactosidase
MPSVDGGADPSGRRDAPMGALKSFYVGGFECSTKVIGDTRLDLLASTQHDRLALPDYRALADHGIRTARDGFRWHRIERSPGAYDWSSVRPMLEAARLSGTQVIWDLCHYGWPDGLDIWSADFVDRFAEFARAAADLIGREMGEAPWLCPINEISFWAWAGGEVGHFAPAQKGRGAELKRQLVRAAVRATKAVKEVAPGARFVCAEPLIHVDPGRDKSPANVAAAADYTRSQFEATDMLTGRLEPELGGGPDCLDLVGVNFYPHNQWYHRGSTIPLGHHAYRPLRELLRSWAERYGLPLILSETGAEGTARASWLHYVSGEVAAARDAGVPVEGICLYPILDYPGWEDGRSCETGLFSAADSAGRRSVHRPLAEELHAQQTHLRGVVARSIHAAA